jgi:hypothetical protein
MGRLPCTSVQPNHRTEYVEQQQAVRKCREKQRFATPRKLLSVQQRRAERLNAPLNRRVMVYVVA